MEDSFEAQLTENPGWSEKRVHRKGRERNQHDGDRLDILYLFFSAWFLCEPIKVIADDQSKVMDHIFHHKQWNLSCNFSLKLPIVDQPVTSLWLESKLSAIWNKKFWPAWRSTNLFMTVSVLLNLMWIFITSYSEWLSRKPFRDQDYLIATAVKQNLSFRHLSWIFGDEEMGWKGRKNLFGRRKSQV